MVAAKVAAGEIAEAEAEAEAEAMLGVRLLPTPQAHDKGKGKAERVGRFGSKHGGRNLNDEVAKLATPKARDARDARAPGGNSELNRHTPDLPATMGGLLNPVFVEWMMGWPARWTELSPMADQPPHGWDSEWPDVPRIIESQLHRVQRIIALGNGQVPVVAALAWTVLTAACLGQDSDVGKLLGDVD